MDSILIVGKVAEKIPGALEKLGYRVCSDEGFEQLEDAVEENLVDLIILGESQRGTTPGLCKQLRRGAMSKRLPIVLIAKSKAEIKEVEQLGYDRIECIEPPGALGTVISRVATGLRLRKMVGGESEKKATLSEMNAHLRELTEKHKKELEEAKKIQESLHPESLPEGETFEMAAVCIQLDDVGGDWYFVQKTPTGKISFQIADVTGHGLPAAFIGVMTKLAMVATAKEQPNELLFGMNNLMAPEMPAGRFVTMACCLYDPETHTLTSSRAGHPPVFVFHRSKDSILEMMEGGLAVGFFEGSEYEAESTTLEVNDVAVLITDGLSEGQNRDMALYGHDGVQQALRETSAEDSANDVMNQVVSHFMDFTQGRALKDDVTVIVLKRTA